MGSKASYSLDALPVAQSTHNSVKSLKHYFMPGLSNWTVHVGRISNSVAVGGPHLLPETTLRRPGLHIWLW